MSLPRSIVAVAASVLTVGALLAPTAQASPGSPALPAAPAAPAASAAASFTPAAPVWGTCSDPTLQRFKAQCAKIEVPLDYAKPGGTKIKLAISRVLHTTKKFQGVMLVNPGGPGGSGLIYSVLQTAIPKGAGDSYDWIGFDPRGVGASEPEISCDPTFVGDDRPRYVPASPAISEEWFARDKAYAKACDAKNGPILDHLTTVDSVNDMESIRKALGEKQINYYGFSYGTYLGQVYGTLYPTHLRRVVFDGTVDPRGVWYKDNLAQDRAFDPNVNTWFAWVAKNNATYHLGTTEAAVRLTFYRTQDKLDENPADGKNGKIGGREWNDTFLSAGYYVYGWADLAQAFSSYVLEGDISGVEAQYPYDPSDPKGDNGYAVYLGVQCTDSAFPKSWRTWERDSWRIFQKAPYATWANTWFNEPCRYWPAKAHKPVKINGKKVKSLLMINETRDAATPYAGSLQVRKLFPKARLIEGVGGTTHAGSLSGVACTDDRIAAYLADGTLPKRKSGRRSDVKCQPVPAPEPTAPTARSKKAVDKTVVDLKRRNLPH